MDASSPPPTGLAFWALPIVAGLCSSDFQEWQRLCHDPPSLAALSLGADTQAQLQLFESHLADLALVSAASGVPPPSQWEPPRAVLHVRSSPAEYFTLAKLFFAIVDWRELLLQLLSAFRGQVAGKQWQAGAARQS